MQANRQEARAIDEVHCLLQKTFADRVTGPETAMTPLYIVFVTACTALLTAIVTPIIAFRTTRAQINANVISINRQKWIESFRLQVATLCSQLFVIAKIRDQLLMDGRVATSLSPDLLARFEDVIRTFVGLQLMINPIEEDHCELIASLEAIVDLLRHAPLTDDLESNLDHSVGKIVTLTQRILKREWVRVKSLQ